MELEKRFDVLIVGGGLSGIGAACHLQRRCPGKSFVILEGRDSIGGTWDLFRYPGIRSDSDMHTLGYAFKPWREAKAIADGPSILRYIRETAEENRLMGHIRLRHQVQAAAWSSADAQWTLEAQRGDGSQARFVGNFLLMCGGYYSYQGGHAPRFEGQERFRGTLVHPQQWPEDLDCAGKRVAVIGSGATAVTLAPALAERGAQVALVQRSPTYVVSRPDEDSIANTLRKWLPERLAYAITRWKNHSLQSYFYRRSRERPEQIKALLLGMVGKALGPGYDLDTHFTPRYDPWDQRMCLVPNGDLFRAIGAGALEMVTDGIQAFTERGLRLASGRELPADIIVTATGLKLATMGGARLRVDGRPVHLPGTFSYRGMMYSDVPNLVQTFGYINASWTLRADLIAEYACRLLKHMDALGARQCTPRLGERERDMEARPWIEGFSSGYMRRAMHLFPKQGDRDPWRNPQNYALERKLFRKAPLEDGALVFSGPGISSPSLSDANPRNPGRSSRVPGGRGRVRRSGNAGRRYCAR